MNASLKQRLAIAPLIAVLASIAVSADNTEPNARWAEKLFERPKVDFGTVPKGLDCRPIVRINNNLNVRVRIAEISDSSGMRHRDPPRKNLLPSDSLAIELQPDTRRYMGRKDSSIHVTFDQPEFVQVTIPITGVIRSDLVVYPGQFDFGTVKAGEATTKTIAIRYLGDQNLKIVSAKCPDKTIDVSFQETQREIVEGGKTDIVCELSLTRRADAPTGEIDTHVTVELDDRPAKPFEVIVRGEFREAKSKLERDTLPK